MIKNELMVRAGRNIPTAVRVLYVISIFVAVLPFGAVRPFPITLSTIFAAIVALLSLIVFGRPVRGRSLFLTFAILGVVTFAWVWMQSLSFLPSGFDNALWGDLPLASLSGKGSISIAPADSVHTLLFVAVPLLAFMTGLIVIRSDDDARMVINSLAIGGALCALYGIIQFSFFPDTNLFFPKEVYSDSLTATFVNHNTAGTFLGLVALVTFRCAWSAGKKKSLARMTIRLVQNRHVDTAGLTSFLLFSFLFICTVLALMLTKSRGATAASIAAFSLMLYFLLAQKGASGKSSFSTSLGGKTVFMRILAVLVVLGITFAVFGGRTLLRAEAQGGEDGRYCVLPGIVELAKGEPILGYGFGSFFYAFPPFRDPACGIVTYWTHAHNTFLDGYIGLGILFPVLVVVGCGAVFVAHVIGIRERRRMRSYSAMGLAGMVLLGFHSLVDFPLEVPGMATFAAALLSATSSISLAKSPPFGSQSRSSIREPA